MRTLTGENRLIVVFAFFIAAAAGDVYEDSLRPTEQRNDTHPTAFVFLQEPDDIYYIIKAKPATITCKATGVLQIYFKCVGQWIEPGDHVNVEGQDAATKQKFLQTSIDVTREEVEEYFGPEGYWCECHAWNEIQNQNVPRAYNSYRSKRGVIQVAYLRKQFEREPLSTSAELESTVQLQCLPPVGEPIPEVFWLKDGEVVDVLKEINFIISNEGNLIISQSRLSDMGNYTCGAQNLASRRLSESAFLTVYVNGGWSTWSQWNECSTPCGKGYQRRTRSCNNPSPLNGGAPCQGEAQQRVPCTNLCPVHGYWSTWSSWSTCSPDCKQHRRRMCDNPAPQNGGRYCDGSDLNTSNCTSGLCRGSEAVGHSYAETYKPSYQGTEDLNNTALYVAVPVSIVFFILVIVIIIIVVLVRRHKAWPSNTDDSKKLNKLVQDVKVQPDLTRTVLPDPHGCVANEKLLSVHSDNSRVIYNKDPISTLPKPGTDYPLYNDGIAAEEEEHLYHQPASTPDDADTNHRRSLISGLFPGNVDMDALTWATVTHAGGRIALPYSGVSMTIPEGAVAKGCREEMFLAILREDKDRLKLAETQTMLGPVVVCGPSKVRLCKPLIITFQHCASIKHGQWMLSIYCCDTPYGEPPHWQLLSTLGQETVNTQVYTQVDLSHCHIMTDCLMRYTLIGEPNMASKAIKILRIAAFAPAIPSSMDYNLRVYFVEDTMDALEGVVQLEKRLGCCLVEKPKQILFQFGGANLCLAMEDVGPGWRSKLPANYQEIPFWHIWSGTQNGLHCSFALEHLDRTQDTFSCDIHVFQKALMANRQVLQIMHNLKEKTTGNLSCIISPHCQIRVHDSTISSEGSVALSQCQHIFRLPVHVKRQLSALLDPPNARGNDWRMLAQRLSVDRYINYFATKQSPTEHVLDLWEARHREDSAVTDLLNSLRVMGRMDAAAIIENELTLEPWL